MLSPGWEPFDAPHWRPEWNHPRRRDCTTVSLQGLEIQSLRGGKYLLSGLTGWSEAPSMRQGIEPYDDADGGWRTDVHAGGRQISIEGSVRTRTHRELEEAVAQLGTVLTRERWDWLRVDEAELGMARQIRVYRPAPVQITRTGMTHAIFTLGVESATFPRLAVEESSLTLKPGQKATATNLGDYSADLALELVGPLTAPSLQWGSAGSSWDYRGSIPSGSRRIVNLTRRIIRDPAAGLRVDASGSGIWTRLPPGDTAFTMGGSGSGSMTLTWRSSWA